MQNVVISDIAIFREADHILRGCAKKNPRILWKWVGGWVQVSFGIVFVGKSSQNISKPVQIFWNSIPHVFCLYIHC